MKKVILVFSFLIFLCTLSLGQGSLSALLNQLDPNKAFESPKKDHSLYTYQFNYDDTTPSDTILSINGNDYGFNQSTLYEVTWDGNNETTKAIKGDNGFSISNEYDKNGLIVKSFTRYVNTDMASMMNEDKMIDYDDKGRLLSISTLKSSMPSPNVMVSLVYDDGLFPKSMKTSVMFEGEMTRSIVNDTMIFTMETSIPKDLIEMVKNELGEDATMEQIQEALGPMGKMEREYNKILKTGDTYTEWYYKEVENNKVLHSISIIDENLNILKNENYSNGKVRSTTSYVYTPRGKLKSMTIDGETLENKYDLNDKLIVEWENSMTKNVYTYNPAGDLSAKKVYLGERVQNFEVYKY